MRHQTGTALFIVIPLLELSLPTLAGDIQHCRRPEEAPAWAVPYGKEFWRQRESTAQQKASARQTAVRISSSIDLGDVMERVSHAWVFDGKSLCATVNGQGYTASFDGRGFRISPHLPGMVGRSPLNAGTSLIMRPSMQIQEPFHWLAGIESSPRIVLDQGRRPEARPALLELEATFRTVSVRRGNQGHYAVGQTTPAWSVLSNTAQALLEPNSGLVEHYEARAEGITVTWVLNKPVSGTGSLTVEAELLGLNSVGQTLLGHHFADTAGTARLRVGRVAAVDASSRRWDLALLVERNRLVVTVPEWILFEAKYPLAIDPVIGPEFGMDQPVLGLAPNDQAVPSIGSNGRDYLVVWHDKRNSVRNDAYAYETYAARVGPDGVVLDPAGFLLTTQYGSGYQIASDGRDYLVVWDFSGIRGVRVSREGAVLDSPELFISPTTQRTVTTPGVASNGTNYFVAWVDRITAADFRSNYNVSGTRVSGDGRVQDPTSILINTVLGDQWRAPVVASDGKDYLVTWQDGREFSSTNLSLVLYGARVRSDGVVADPNGVKISPFSSWLGTVSVASNGGDFLVAWDSTNSLNSDVVGARIDRQGAVSSLGVVSKKAFLVTAVAASADDYFVLSADSPNNSGATVNGILKSRVGRGGVIGNPVKIADAPGLQRVAASNGEGFLIVRTGNGWWTPSGYDVLGAVVPSMDVGVAGPDFGISRMANRQRSPSVACNGERSMVVWEDNRGTGGNSPRLYGVRINPAGQVIDPNGIQLASAVSDGFDVASNGSDYLVVWSTAGKVFRVHVTSSGIVTETAELAIENTNTFFQFEPSLASNGADYLVVWQTGRPGTESDIYGTRISGDGRVLDLAGIGISRAVRYQSSPRVASDGKDYLVVWEDWRDLPSNDIYGARIESTGKLIDQDGIAISTVKPSPSSPAIGFNGEDYWVVWEDRRTGPNPDIYGTRVSRNGVVIHPVGMSICSADGAQSSPAVAANRPGFLSGDILVVWGDERNGAANGSDIYGTRVSPDGTVWDGAGFVINSGAFDQSRPSVASIGLGQFLVANQSLKSGADRVVANVVSVFEKLVRRQGKTILTWPAVTGKTYRLEFKDDLNAPVWNDLDGDATTTNGTISIVDETVAGVPQRFYRLIEK